MSIDAHYALLNDPTRGQPAPAPADGAPLAFWHPGPNPTADLLVMCGAQLLLVQRGPAAAAFPGWWALPGGFQDSDARPGTPWQPGRETAEQAAYRELQEETGLQLAGLPHRLQFVGLFDAPERDPRNTPQAWAISCLFRVQLQVKAPPAVVGADDVSAAAWWPLTALPPLAFDHQQMVARGLTEHA